MSTIRVGENEPVESAIKRFKRKRQKDNITQEINKRKEYVKPSVKKKLKQEEAIKQSRRKNKKRKVDVKA